MINSVIDSPLHQLYFLVEDERLTPVEKVYAKIRMLFLSGDVAGLTSLRPEIDRLESDRLPVKSIYQLRLGIRNKTLTPEFLAEMEALSLDGVWEAEKLFCLGMAFEKLGEEQRCALAFTKARSIYARHGCGELELRSYYNSVMAQSRIAPHKNFVLEYQALASLAKDLGAHSIEGMTLTMISREYQILGLLDQAFLMVEEALSRLLPERGSFHYFHAVLHKAHVLLDLARVSEARDCLKEAELATFVEIEMARRLLLASLEPGVGWDQKWEQHLLPTWKNRVPSLLKRLDPVKAGPESLDLTPLEIKLIRLAYNGPIEKWDLIEKLYGGEESMLRLENRFKNLIARVRKKHPMLIICDQGRYYASKIPWSDVG